MGTKNPISFETDSDTSVRRRVLRCVSVERDRQETLRREGRFPYTCASPEGLSHSDKLAVLAEEFGEVARHVTEGVIDPARIETYELRKELIEVAAVAVAWAESLTDEG